MKAILFFGGMFLMLSACSEPDTICACIETGRKLDRTAQQILTKGTSPQLEKELIALKKERVQKCSEFDRMDNDEMLKRMENCE